MNSPQDTIIQQYAKGRTFADVGGLWGVKNEKVSVASLGGAREATLIDVVPHDNALWTQVRDRCASLGVVGYREIVGSVDDPGLPDKSGRFDFVHCSGIIYHCPNPIETLVRLHALTNKYLLLASMTVPPRIATASGEMTFEPGVCVSIPALKGQRKAIVTEHFAARKIRVHNITPGFDAPWYSDGKPSYGPWWWLWTGETLADLVGAANFRVLDVVETWTGQAHAVLAEKV
jgi:hypothetical protein